MGQENTIYVYTRYYEDSNDVELMLQSTVWILGEDSEKYKVSPTNSYDNCYDIRKEDVYISHGRKCFNID